MRSGRPILAAGVVLLLVAFATACGGQALPVNERGETKPPKPALTIVTAPAGLRDAPMALVGGVLEVDERRGCVLLSGRPVIWPVGTALVHRPLAIRLPDGRTLRPGDALRGGGGAVPASHWPEAMSGDVAALRRCAEKDDQVILLNHPDVGEIQIERA